MHIVAITAPESAHRVHRAIARPISDKKNRKKKKRRERDEIAIAILQPFAELFAALSTSIVTLT